MSKIVCGINGVMIYGIGVHTKMDVYIPVDNTRAHDVHMGVIDAGEDHFSEFPTFRLDESSAASNDPYVAGKTQKCVEAIRTLEKGWKGRKLIRNFNHD